MSSEELWRAVPSYPGVLASSFGRIMVAPYTKRGRQYGGQPTSGQWDGARYIYARRGYKTLKVARLVCEAFHGAPLAEETVCMHLNENSRDNRQENLSWGTQKENLNAPGFLEYCHSRVGENSTRAKSLGKQ